MDAPIPESDGGEAELGCSEDKRFPALSSSSPVTAPVQLVPRDEKSKGTSGIVPSLAIVSAVVLLVFVLEWTLIGHSSAQDYDDRGIAKQKQGDFDGAIADYTHAIELDPKYALAFGNRGTAKQNKGDLDGAIELARRAVEAEYACADMVNLAAGTAVLVNALLRRGGPTDLLEAQAAIDRLAAVPTEPGFVVNEIWLLRMRTLEAQARGDEPAYRDYRDRYRAMANSLGFEGHIAWAEAMS